VNILNILTLGLLPLYRMLTGAGKDKLVLRTAGIRIYFNPFGNPPASKLVKVFRKFGYSPVEADVNASYLSRGDFAHASTDDEADEIVHAIQDAGFKYEDYDTWEMENSDARVWDSQEGEYLEVRAMRACNSCGRIGRMIRFYLDYNKELRCSACDSTDVRVPYDLNYKELQEYVTAWRKNPPAPVGRQRTDDDLAVEVRASATRSR
jgi:hypothetical protein